jgi:hypothetical protein
MQACTVPCDDEYLGPDHARPAARNLSISKVPVGDEAAAEMRTSRAKRELPPDEQGSRGGAEQVSGLTVPRGRSRDRAVWSPVAAANRARVGFAVREDAAGGGLVGVASDCGGVGA